MFFTFGKTYQSLEGVPLCLCFICSDKFCYLHHMSERDIIVWCSAINHLCIAAWVTYGGELKFLKQWCFIWIDAFCPSSFKVHMSPSSYCFNSLRLRQIGRHFPDDIFKYILLNENVWISIKISLKFVPKGPINNIPLLVRIMAWHRLWWLVYWRIYASLRLNELTLCYLVMPHGFRILVNVLEKWVEI